ncbi:hypothetical protein AURDEDRAFT_162963 [Auricularia subglabra TFB-10046 SS5]|nr:hypothetical protein AURDEDRAFT_162963 [Auricularia subglabra TFB-10046 SS5]
MDLVSAADSHGDETEAMVVDDVPGPTATPHDTPPDPHVVHESPQLPPRSATAWETPQMLSSPRVQYPAQPSIDSWVGSSVPAPSPLPIASADAGLRSEMRDRLAGMTSFGTFWALAISSGECREVAAEVPKLNFSEASDVMDAHMRVDLLYELAPNLTHLSIKFPVSPSLEQSVGPTLEYLCIDEGNREVWSPNHMGGSLDALRARHVRELEVRNASEETVQAALGFLDDIIDGAVVDDGGKRYMKFVDRDQRTHAYDGPLIGVTSFLFTKEHLGDITRLIVNDSMTPHELAVLFGRGGPPHLNELGVWFGAKFSLLAARTDLLAYRGPGRGAFKSVKTLRLTTTPPLAGISPRNAPPRTPLSRSLVEGFLAHVRGCESVLGRDVQLELDGIAVEGYDADFATSP